MRGGRGIAAGVLAAAMTMTVVATPAVAQETTPEGTASTELVGADVAVSGLGDDIALRLMELTTQANTGDSPFASTSIVPIDLGGETVGESGASSDGNTEASSPGGAFGDQSGLLGVAVQPVATSATADAAAAIAEIEAVIAELAALSSAIDIDLNATDITSRVTGDGALGTQSLAVTDLGLDLDGLGLSSEILGQLGLDQILALLDSLDIDGLPAGAGTLYDEIIAAQGDLQDALDQFVADAEIVQDTADQLAAIDGEIGLIQELDSLLTTVSGLADLAALLLDGDLVTRLIAVDCDPTLLSVTALQDVINCLTTELDGARDRLVADGVDGLDGVAAEELFATLTTVTEGLLAALPTELQGLLDEIGGIETLTQTLGDLLADLDGLLDLLPDLLDEAAAMDLFSVGAFDIGVTAFAGETVDDSRASVLCAPVDVTVLGQAFSTPDCSEGLSAVSGVTDQITAALAGVTDVLNTLPLDGAVQAGDLRVDLFTNLVEDVSEADGIVTATAGFNLLELQVPSVTIDPSAVTDPLIDLGVPDVLGTLDSVITELATAVNGLDGTEDGVESLVDDTGLIDEAVGLIADLEAAIGAGSTLSNLVADAIALLDGLDLGAIGTLTDGISTPSISLVIDPVSTATFGVQAAGGGPGTDPAPDPAPDTGDEKDLPSTGGGAAIAGLVALMGAAGILRRRK